MKTSARPDQSAFARKLEQESGLTHSQLQIWTAQQVHPESPFCNMAFAIVIEGALDVSLFQQAWSTVFARSDALRTCVEEVDGLPRRRLHDADASKTDYIDLSAQADPVLAFRSWTGQRCATPLPLSGVLVQSTLCKLSEARFGWYLNQHHLVTDAAATVLLFQAVAKAYGALRDGATHAATAGPGYYDTVQSLRSSAAAITGKARQHWSEKRTDGPRSMPIYGKSGDPSLTGSNRVEIVLSQAESDGLRALAKEPEFASFFPETSLYAVLATLLAAFLKRVTGQERISFDSPAGNRPSPAAKQSLGCFIEMFPVDLDSEDCPTFRALGARCTETIHEFLAHVAPAASSPDGANAGNVVLNFFPHAFGPFAGLPIRADWIHSGHIDGVYDLKLQAHDYNGSGRFTLQLDLSTATFSAYDRERLPAHLRRTLQAMLENVDTRMDDFDILTAEERRRTLVDYNRPAAHPVPDEGLLPRIARIARQHPDDTALRQGAETISYRTLWEQVGRAAAALRRIGVTNESCVAIVMPRSSQAVLAILATMRAGAAFIPIDTNQPVERIARILANARPHCSIHLDEPADGENAQPVPRLAWSSLLETHDSSEPVPPFPKPDDLAYVIYTSGSTGAPKGVEIEHRGMIAYLDWAQRSYVRGERLRYPLFTSLSFDLTLTSVFLPFMTGGELIVYPPAAVEVDSALIDVINDNAVDFLKLTPSHFSLLKQIDLGASRITRLVLGGEDLKHSLAASVAAQFPHEVELYNEYGPTEAVVGCMIHKLDPGRKAPPGASVPIGRPADHVAILLLNAAGRPVPEGVPGELCIARHGLARGYRNDPDKTAAVFVRHPFAPDERIYRTGDLARFSDEGEMTFLGRIDSQVKVSGHRIELGEIEAALLEQVEIENAFVHAHRSRNADSTPRALSYCRTCGLASNYPNVVFDERGVCNTCNAFESIKDEAQAYFQASDQLVALFESSRRRHQAKYDCMMLYSGGKDSTYALGKLVDLGLHVYAFTLDNGYISEQAKTNIRRVVSALGVDHEFATTPAMNEIFRDSLTRFSNVCNGCFKTIYTLGMSRARELHIPIIVTGLSRGQFFETRLTGNLFQQGRFSPSEVDQAVLEARKAYHRVDDAVSRLLDTSHLKNDRIFEEISFVDFYRYWDASLEEIYSYLARRLPWIRPSDTGRSTNCLVNDVGIYIHKKERGYHNYALPYSWDVRMGHKQRDEALQELDDRYDVTEVRRMLKELGYNEDRLSTGQERVRLTAYYVSRQALDAAELERRLSRSLPAQMRPSHYVRLDAIPLTPNGKVDIRALPKPDEGIEQRRDPIEPPQGPVEEHVFGVWAQCFKTRAISRTDSFFQLGGTSLDAMEVILQLCRDFDIDLPLQTIFTKPRLADLCQAIESKVVEDVDRLSEDEAEKFLRT